MVCGVVAQRLARNIREHLAHFEDVLCTPHLFAVGQPEDEVAEAQTAAHETAQALQQRRVCFVKELYAQLAGDLAVLRQR